MVEVKNPQKQARGPEAFIVFGRSGTGKSTINCAMLKGKDYDIKIHNDLFKVSNGLSGTTQRFDAYYSEPFGITLFDSIGLGDPDIPIPVWLELFNDLIKSEIQFGSIIIVLEHRLRPDSIDEQFLTIVD